MSILVADLNVYEAVFEKAWKYGFNKTVNINYCNVLSFDNEEILKNHVKNWLILNELSYIRRYEDGTNERPHLHEFLTFRKTFNIDTYQMLKYLQCILYNIELSTIRTGKTGNEKKMDISADLIESYNLLKKAIEEIQIQIINEIPQYQSAKWCEI